MRKTKVTVLLLLMALTVSLLAGCGGKEEEKQKTDMQRNCTCIIGQNISRRV